ncbi:unnamed protein product [Bursaphelenchus okinawaensis]|uniref:Uncharacterized protein n=1 Tax=Bursaphelenchus okinawaensis TaxID=465554 RepID=A0A811KCL3_9BILA|nr:unnamed protein product [Bursaphelenchus okinawaensis]CAG9101730.1 unnamed protein product [Bursaphelenchus okinawaensis]
MEWSKWIKHLLNFCKWCLTAWIIESVLEYVESTEKTIYDTIFNFVLAFFIFIGLRRYLNKVEDGGAKEKEKNELTDQPNEKEEGTKKAVENVTKVGKAIKTADTRPTSLHERIKETTEELKTGEEKLELRITEKMLEETIQQKDKALRHLTEDNAKLSKSLAELQKNFESKVSEADDFKNRLQVSLKDLHCQKQMFMSQRSLIVKNWSENEKLRCENQKLKCAIEKLKQEANQETVQKRNEVEKKHQEECNKYKEEAEKHQEKVKKLDAELKDYREKFDKECRASREYDNKLRAKESLIMKLERKHIWTVIELDQLKQKHGLKNYSARAPLGELPLEFFDNEAQEKKQKKKISKR